MGSNDAGGQAGQVGPDHPFPARRPRCEATATPAGRAARRPRAPGPAASGGASGAVRIGHLAAARRSTADAATASARGRPWAETTTASSQGRPRRAKARATDDGAGWTARRSGPSRAPSARTMPKKPGSPDASTHTRAPAAARSATSVRTASSGPRSGTASAPERARRLVELAGRADHDDRRRPRAARRPAPYGTPPEQRPRRRCWPSATARASPPASPAARRRPCAAPGGGRAAPEGSGRSRARRRGWQRAGRAAPSASPTSTSTVVVAPRAREVLGQAADRRADQPLVGPRHPVGDDRRRVGTVGRADAGSSACSSSGRAADRNSAIVGPRRANAAPPTRGRAPTPPCGGPGG